MSITIPNTIITHLQVKESAQKQLSVTITLYLLFISLHSIQHWQFLKAFRHSSVSTLPRSISSTGISTSLSPKYVSPTQCSPMRNGVSNCQTGISTWTLKPVLIPTPQFQTWQISNALHHKKHHQLFKLHKLKPRRYLPYLIHHPPSSPTQYIIKLRNSKYSQIHLTLSLCHHSTTTQSLHQGLFRLL